MYDFKVRLIFVKTKNHKAMKKCYIFAVFAICTLLAASCSTTKEGSDDDKNQVIETIMARRSIRKYKEMPVGRDTMQIILECGINAPNAINRQAWEIRVVDDAQWLSGLSDIVAKTSPMGAKMASEPGYRNAFRNAPTVVFIGHDTNFSYSPVDCGLMGENMILAAWSMGVGSVVLGSPVSFFKVPEAAQYYKDLGFSEGYELLYCIAFGYADESPDAKPRDVNKIKFVN